MQEQSDSAPSLPSLRSGAPQRLKRRYRARFLRFPLQRLLDVVSPLYSPRKKRAPRGAAELLNEIRPAA